MNSTFSHSFSIDVGAPMNDKNVVQGDKWRIGLLTDSLVRFEWSENGNFTDNATQTVVKRDFGGVVEYQVQKRNGLLYIETDSLIISYDMMPFSKEGLSVIVKGVPDSQFNTWHYGDKALHNLGGTARTLDVVDGKTPLEEGILSRDGWAIIDDSNTNLVVEAPSGESELGVNTAGTWIGPRDGSQTDLYFFGYGRRYQQAIADFYRLSGGIPLLPRFALGNWWSRYYKYSQESYLQLMEKFEQHGIPFTTAVIDIDWHPTQVDPKYGSGWTGYSWNRELFPEPEEFLSQLHQHGVKTTLNLHPRDGFRAFEDCYPQVAQRMGLDPMAGEQIEFDIASPKFASAYFEVHRQLEKQGVDFWWIDWQQGGVSRQKNLDPLWMLNHLHFLDSGRDGRWPLTFSRYAGPGSHRYSIGFSGDSIVSWDSLKFQPYFTATASNIGYAWWSHDIGGHMLGERDAELEARWYQLGTFSPINRLHSSSSPFMGKEPWNFNIEVEKVMVDALRLRQQLLPYLYSMNWRAASEGKPLVEPMYWQSPEIEDAYEVPQEYRFGSQLVVAPITSPADVSVQRASADAWLPQGLWFDFFDGRHYASTPEEGLRFRVWRELEKEPVFARAGGIVPLQRDGMSNSVENPREMDVIVFPGADGAFDLVEDFGKLESTRNEVVPLPRAASTGLRFETSKSEQTTFVIGAAQGETACVPQTRSWTITVRGVERPEGSMKESITVISEGREIPFTVDYDEESLSLSVALDDVSSSAETRVIYEKGLHVARNPIVEDIYRLLLNAQMNLETKERIYKLVQEDPGRTIASLDSFESDEMFALPEHILHLPDSVKSAVREVLSRD